VLGETAGEDLIRKRLREYFAKYGVKASDWDINFYNNKKLKNSDVFDKLKKGQSRFSVIITGQIYAHTGKGNESANILTELGKEKYINHIVGCSPREKLTCDNIINKLEEYLVSKYVKTK
jgi:type III restriction enzyme